jgi:hypothetical protein
MEVGQFLPVVPPGLAEGWQYSIFYRHLNFKKIAVISEVY